MFRSGLAISQIMFMNGSRQAIASCAIGCAHDRLIPNLGLYGGYPGGRRNTIFARYDNIKELIEKRKPLLSEVNPIDFGKDFPGKVERKKYTMSPFEVKDWDCLIVDNTSAGGLGDPIDRRPEWVIADLDKGLTTREIARNIYCVSVKFDKNSKKWKVNQAETDRLRQAKRKERLSRGVPVQQWWGEERRRVADKDMHLWLLEMYQSSMKMSQKFAREFRGFWALPDDFTL